MYINFNPFPIIKTERLVLNAVAENDALHILELRKNETANALIGRTNGSTIHDAIDFIRKRQQDIATNESIYWSIQMKSSSIFIGTICIWNIQQTFDTVEIGYEMLPQHEGNGYMSEAVQAVNQYAFKTMKAKKIIALPHKNNYKSIALLDRLKFKHSSKNIANLHYDELNLVTYILEK